MPITSGGKKGKSGRKSLRQEWEFFSKLDSALPSTIDFCVEVMENCKLNLLKPDLKFSDAKMIQDTGLKAAQILMSKAPQRSFGGGEEGEFVFKVSDDEYEKTINNIARKGIKENSNSAESV